MMYTAKDLKKLDKANEFEMTFMQTLCLATGLLSMVYVGFLVMSYMVFTVAVGL